MCPWKTSDAPLPLRIVTGPQAFNELMLPVIELPLTLESTEREWSTAVLKCYFRIDNTLSKLSS